LEVDEHIGWLPRMVRTERKIKVAMLVCANCSQMVDEVEAVAPGIKRGTCHRILPDDLNMSHLAQNNIPRILSQDQHDSHMSTCGDLISSVDKDETFLNSVLTGDRTIFFCMICN
jgi:hypothetical protein